MAPNVLLSFILFVTHRGNISINVIVEAPPRVHLLNVNEIKKPISTKIFLSVWYFCSNTRAELIPYDFSSHYYYFLNIIFGRCTHSAQRVGGTLCLVACHLFKLHLCRTCRALRVSSHFIVGT